MIIRLLKEFSKSNSYSKYNTSKKLGVSPEIVDAMFNKLISLNYIEKVKNYNCSGNCGLNCSKNGCSCGTSGELVSMWKITSKGKSALERM
jgi:hypothetical protein